MLPTPRTTQNALRAKYLAVLLFLGGLSSVTSQAAVSAGGIAILGYTDTNTYAPLSDTFTIAALEEIVSGTTLYFTNNGWNSFDSAPFPGVNATVGPPTASATSAGESVIGGPRARSHLQRWRPGRR